MPRVLTKPWYASFLDCTLPHTEAPMKYLLWSAISVIGGVLKNNVYIKDGLYTIYPNQYIILTGPPGIGKGTAINFAWGLVKSDTSQYKLANMVSDRVTAPRILQRIADGWPQKPNIVNNTAIIASREHTCTLFSTELRVLVTASDWMLEFLCESWDRNTYDYDTKNAGSSIIKNMCTSLIGGTVPDYVRGMEKDVDASIAGGFTSRCLFIFEDKKSKELPFTPSLDSNPVSKKLYDNLASDLVEISKLSGEYTLSIGAKIVWENNYKNCSPQPDDSDAILNFKARYKAHVFKLAMVLAAAKSDKLIIEMQDMKDALYMINTIKKQLDRVFRGMGSSQLAEPTARVQAAIEKHGMVSRKELIKSLMRHMTPETLDRILFILCSISFCREQKVNNQVYYVHIPPTPVGGINSNKGVTVP